MTDIPPLPFTPPLPLPEEVPVETPQPARIPAAIITLPESFPLPATPDVLVLAGRVLEATAQLSLIKVLTEHGVIDLKTPPSTLRAETPVMVELRTTPQGLSAVIVARPSVEAPLLTRPLPVQTALPAPKPLPALPPLKQGDTVTLLPLPAVSSAPHLSPDSFTPPVIKNSAFGLTTEKNATLSFTTPPLPVLPGSVIDAFIKSELDFKWEPPISSPRETFSQPDKATRPASLSQPPEPNPQPLLQSPPPPAPLSEKSAKSPIAGKSQGVFYTLDDTQQFQSLESSLIDRAIALTVARLPHPLTLQAQILKIFFPKKESVRPQNRAEETPAAPLHTEKPVPATKQPAKTQEPAAFIAEVESQATPDYAIVKTDIGRMILKTPAPLEEGTRLTLTPPQPAPVPEPVNKPNALPPPIDLFGGDDWPVLREGLKAIQDLAPAEISTAVKYALPSPTPHLAPTTLFFLAALRLGDVEKWLGEPALKSLRQSGRVKLAEALTSDFESIARQSRTPVSGGWTMIPIPLMNDEALTQMRLYVRRQTDDQNEEGRPEGGISGPVTRFILNLRLSRMGEMQLDGLMKKKNIDLVLRTDKALPASTREDLAQKFADGLGQARVTGTLAFQTRGQSWVTIDPPSRPGTVV